MDEYENIVNPDEPDLDAINGKITRVLQRVASSRNVGHLFKEFKGLFTLLDPWGISGLPDCRIMPFVQAHIQEAYVLEALSKMWPSEVNDIKERTIGLAPVWSDFCKAQTGNNKKMPYDIAGTEWPTLMIPCPLLSDSGACAIGWRRPSGCLSENPNFLSICQQLDAKMLKKEGKICLSIMDILLPSCVDPYGSRRLTLPMR